MSDLRLRPVDLDVLRTALRLTALRLGFPNTHQVAESLGITPAAARYRLRKLAEAGLISCNGPDWVAEATCETYTALGLARICLEAAQALLNYAAEKGETWKRDLNRDWARSARPGYLQALRNSHGPEWLAKLDLDELQGYSEWLTAEAPSEAADATIAPSPTPESPKAPIVQQASAEALARVASQARALSRAIEAATRATKTLNASIEALRTGIKKLPSDQDLYLSWVNDFLSVSAFADYYGLAEREARDLIEREWAKGETCVTCYKRRGVHADGQCNGCRS